jgi:hypothetical protein
MSNLRPFLVIIACVLCLSGISNISKIFMQAQDSYVEHRSMGELPIINQNSMIQLDAND